MWLLRSSRTSTGRALCQMCHRSGSPGRRESEKKELSSPCSADLFLKGGGGLRVCWSVFVKVAHPIFLFSATLPPGEVVSSTLKSECGADKWLAAALQLCLWYMTSCLCACYTKMNMKCETNKTKQ